MKVTLVGRDLDQLRKYLDQFRLEEVDRDPDVVITHGGDGTLIGAERDFPLIPKVPIRNSRICKKCPKHTTEAILKRLTERSLVEDYEPKVRVNVGDRHKIAMNEVGIQLFNPASAVRFRIDVDGSPYIPHEIIGDGMLVATPFGSSAYFRSITRGTFRQGLGLAIINSVEPVEWAVLDEESEIRVEITRGPGILIEDNDPDQWRLDAGTVLNIRVDENRARIFGIDALRCKKCQVENGSTLKAESI